MRFYARKRRQAPAVIIVALIGIPVAIFTVSDLRIGTLLLLTIAFFLARISHFYLNDAPVGKIFGDGSKALKPVYLAPKDQDVRTAAIEPAIQSIEQGKATPDQGWQKLLADAKGQVK